MKKLFLITALLLGSMCFTVQAELAKVKLKNGVELTGTLISMDPTENIVLEIGGKQSTIKMSDIESVEKVVENAQTTTRGDAPTNATATENTLPKEKIVNIAGHDVKFVLVPSHTFSYGYDGDGSRLLDSEPVHEVEVSAFYVSEEPVTVDLAKDIMGSNPWGEYEYIYDTKTLERTRNSKYGLDLPVEENMDKLKSIALFYPSFNKYEIQNLQLGKLGKEGESFPAAKSFIAALQQKAGNDVKLLNEVQYASLIKQEIEGVRFPIGPDVMMSVNMNERKDPSVAKYMVKGLDTYASPGGFRNPVLVSKLHNRATMGMHNVDKKKKQVKIYGAGHVVGPLHLVVPAK